MTDVAAPTAVRPFAVLDKLGVLIGAIGAVGAVSPFAAFRANRIVLGEGKSILASLPAVEGALVCAIVAGAILIALFRTPGIVRLAASLVALAAILILIGHAATYLTPEGDKLARVSPAAGFWLLLFAFALLAADALTRMKLKPVPRIGILLAVAAGIALILVSGTWNDLSILKEYANRADAF